MHIQNLLNQTISRKEIVLLSLIAAVTGILIQI